MNGDGDNETWLTGWEQECADEIEEQPDYEQTFVTESDNSHRKIWSAFQDSATAIAQLYRGRTIRMELVIFILDPVSSWALFLRHFLDIIPID